MKQKVLVSWSDNWADEIDCEGFVILDNEEWQENKKTIRKIEREFTLSVGSNEEIEYENGRDFLCNVSAKKVSPEEFAVIKKFFGESGGHDFLDQVLQTAEEQEEEDEYDSELEMNDEES